MGMGRRLLVISIAGVAVLAGCAARTMDDLSTSYERLVAAHDAAEQSRRDPDVRIAGAPVQPPVGQLGSGFLDLGRGALQAASGSTTMPATRIGFYRLGASSAHFTLVEEARTGKPIEVEAAIRQRQPRSDQSPLWTAADVMHRASDEGKALCASMQTRPTRDCLYLDMAESIARLAVITEPWRLLRNLSTVPAHQKPAATLELRTALEETPDTEFSDAVSAYQQASDRALAALGASTLQASPAARVGTPLDFARENDIRSFCLVAARGLKIRSLPADVAMPGLSPEAAASATNAMQDWVMKRHGVGVPSCA